MEYMALQGSIEVVRSIVSRPKKIRQQPDFWW